MAEIEESLASASSFSRRSSRSVTKVTTRWGRTRLAGPGGRPRRFLAVTDRRLGSSPAFFFPGRGLIIAVKLSGAGIAPHQKFATCLGRCR